MRSKHIFIFAGGIAAALLIAGIVWVGHQEQRRHGLEREIAEKQTAAALLDHSQITAGHVNVKVMQLADATARFESRLTPPGEMDKVLENIWRLARVNSLQTKTIKTPAIQRIGGYREQDMEVSLVGDFNGFYQFLLQLEDGRHLLRIRRMHLSKSNESEVQADLTLNIYFKSDGGAI
jgi:Tfp pilus assembly protein PilO